MPSKTELKRSIVSICRMLYQRGYVVATEGNVSARIGPDPAGAKHRGRDTLLVTRRGVPKATIAQGDIVEIDLDGKVLSGKHQPSSEARLHRFIYSKRADIGAIVHAHPVYSTGFAAARRSLTVDSLPEVVVEFGRIPLVPYATPSTREVTDSLAASVKRAHVFLLSNHGVIACGSDLDEAFQRLERLEHAAQIIFNARLLGGERRLSKKQIEKLRRVKKGGKVSIIRTNPKS